MRSAGLSRSRPSLILDSGALIAVERGNHRADVLIGHTMQARGNVAIPAGVVAQVWRHGRRQVVLTRLLNHPLVKIVPLDDLTARAAGVLCGIAQTSDIVDASVVLCAQERGNALIATSDAADIAKLDPNARIVAL